MGGPAVWAVPFVAFIATVEALVLQQLVRGREIVFRVIWHDPPI